MDCRGHQAVPAGAASQCKQAPAFREGTVPCEGAAGAQLHQAGAIKASDPVSGFTSMRLEDILLAVALGHSLHRSESLLAALPREVMQHHLARHIRQLFLEDLSARGLLTPVEEEPGLVTPRRPARIGDPPCELSPGLRNSLTCPEMCPGVPRSSFANLVCISPLLVLHGHR